MAVRAAAVAMEMPREYSAVPAKGAQEWGSPLPPSSTPGSLEGSSLGLNPEEPSGRRGRTANGREVRPLETGASQGEVVSPAEKEATGVMAWFAKKWQAIVDAWTQFWKTPLEDRIERVEYGARLEGDLINKKGLSLTARVFNLESGLMGISKEVKNVKDDNIASLTERMTRIENVIMHSKLQEEEVESRHPVRGYPEATPFARSGYAPDIQRVYG